MQLREMLKVGQKKTNLVFIIQRKKSFQIESHQYYRHIFLYAVISLLFSVCMKWKFDIYFFLASVYFYLSKIEFDLIILFFDNTFEQCTQQSVLWSTKHIFSLLNHIKKKIIISMVYLQIFFLDWFLKKINKPK